MLKMNEHDVVKTGLENFVKSLDRKTFEILKEIVSNDEKRRWLEETLKDRENEFEEKINEAIKIANGGRL